jgi:hypothetical protein
METHGQRQAQFRDRVAASYSAPAISPDGQTVYTANSWWLTPFQTTTASPRLLQNTFQVSGIEGNGAPTGWSTLVTTPPGDGRGGSANGLTSEFLGDYNYASAVKDYGIGVWTADARDASNCSAVDAWRQALADFLTGTGPDPGNPPNPATACPGTFGNIDIWSPTSG